jgi:glycosyltransferase involved in cell wall biosynthesis
MLSILIPVYNWDVVGLVTALHGQCLRSGVDFEIRCYEDGSTVACRERNGELQSYDRVVYRVYEKNAGRAAIRNRLAEDAIQPFLLFLDCDSGLPDEHFIARYLENIAEETILYGGRIYAPDRPENEQYLLHWQYGHERETAAAVERRRLPYHRFMTNNFLIPKSTFMRIGFEERLKQYGHEDTLFGQKLQEQAVPIIHLNNPVIHLGLEEAGVFLEKNRQAMENLRLLAGIYPNLQTQLLTTVARLKQWKLKTLTFIALRGIFPLLKRNLLSGRPRLGALDLFKLYYFLYYDRR